MNIKLSTALLWCVFFLTALSLEAQTCEWLKVGLFSGSNSYNRANSIYTDKDNNTLVVGYFYGSIDIDGTILTTSGGNFNAVIAKYNDTGKLLWARQATGFSHFNDVITDSSGNIYIVGGMSSSINFGNGVTISATGTSTFLVKYNSQGQAQWVRGFTGQTSVLIFSSGVTLAIDPSQNIIVGLSFSNTYSISGTGKSFTTSPPARYDLNISKFKPDGSFINTATFGGSADDNYVDVDCDGKGNIYVAANTIGGFTFGSQNFSTRGMVILKMDSSLNPIKGLLTPFNHNADRPAGITVRKNGYFAVNGIFSGTVDFGGVSLTQTGTQVNCFVNYYTPDFDLLWAKKGSYVNTSTAYAFPTIGMAHYNDYLYFGGNMGGGNMRFGSITLVDAYPTSVSSFVIKLDTLGNFLWGFCNGATAGDSRQFKVAVDKDGDAYITGEWESSIDVFGKSASVGSGSLLNYYAAKISDYTISRGPVKSGPYCAGDTIIIPFTKTGGYSQGNEFIAELSDSAGNFDGNERELGRITSSTGDTVKGTLPLINVPTTNKYRIRIISTKPQVQSFYKLDLLRLLIYSKDTANAGPDITVCNGQSVRLGTTGGSKWSWSPSTYMPNLADTANRQPLIKPDSTVEYRIIISDSSGCGEIDTDYVKVSVRPILQVSLPDTITICKGRNALLKPIGYGGDTQHYYFRWHYADTMYKLYDTAAQQTVSPPRTTTYVVVLWDSCSTKPDTARITVIADSTLMVPFIKDTTICVGNTVFIDATTFACDPGALKYNWNNGLGEGPIKKLSPTNTTSYTIIVTDTISSLSDTVVFKINVLPPLQLAINNDTTICIGQQAELRATTLGGEVANHKVFWSEVGVHGSVVGKNAMVNPTKTTTYRALLTDGCTVLADSAEITITVRDSLKITVNADTTICVGESVELRAVDAGGYSPARSVVWSEVGGLWMVVGRNTLVNPTKTTTYKAVLSDGCSSPNDSAEVTITVRPPLKVTVNKDTTICVGQSAELRATLSGGNQLSHSILWTVDGGQWTNNNSFVTVNPTQTTTYKALLSDNCTNPNDSAQITVTVRPTLSVVASAKDSICSNQILQLNTAVSGGNVPSHSILWTADPPAGGWTSQQNPTTDTPKITTTYIVRLRDNCSPDVYDTLKVIVLPVPKADFVVIPFEGCPPLSVNFTDLSIGNDTVSNRWKIQSNEIIGVKKYSHEFLKSGKYGVGLTTSNALGCVDYIFKPNAITVFDKPQAQFIAKPDIKEIESPVYLYNQSRRADSYTWDMGDGNQFTQDKIYDTLYSYADTGSMVIKLIAKNKENCLDTQTQIIRIHDKMNCVIPSAFTPNGDYINNSFSPVCVGVASYHITIFNRWGQTVLDCDNCTWDGTFGGQAVPPGVYLYKLKLKAYSNKEGTSFGTVQVLR